MLMIQETYATFEELSATRLLGVKIPLVVFEGHVVQETRA